MAGKRLLDADVVHDPLFATLSWLAQLLWDRLWLTTNWSGRGQWRADVLKGQCFPEDNRVTSRVLQKPMEELEEKVKGLWVYEEGGLRFFWLIKWEEIHKKQYKTETWVPLPPKTSGLQMRLDSLRPSTTEIDESVSLSQSQSKSESKSKEKVKATTPPKPQKTDIKISIDLTDQDRDKFLKECEVSPVAGSDWLRDFCRRTGLKGKADKPDDLYFAPLIRQFGGEKVIRVVSHAVTQEKPITKLVPLIRAGCKELQEKGG